jgi:hypothetical protein
MHRRAQRSFEVRTHAAPRTHQVRREVESLALPGIVIVVVGRARGDAR